MNEAKSEAKLPRRILAASMITALPFALAVSALAQSPTPATPDKTAPQAAPSAKSAPKVVDPAVEELDVPAAKDTGAAKGAAAAPGASTTVKDVAIGTAVYDSAGQKIGEVKGVKSGGGGLVEEIHVKTGGFFGLGGKVLVVPGAKIAKGGKSVQLAMTSADISKLPALPDKSG